MKYFYPFFLLVLAILVGLSVTSVEAQKQVEAEQPETYQLMGTVTDEETGKGIPEVEVKIPQGENEELSEMTNEDGEFTFTELPAGKHKIKIDHDGYDKWEKEVQVMQDSRISIELTPSME